MKKIKCRTIFLASILCLLGVFGFPKPIQAASVFNYDRWFSISNANYSSGTLSFPANNISGTSAVNIPANGSMGGSNWKKTSITFIAPNTPPSTEYINGNSFTTTFSLVTNNPYMGNTGTSRAVDITCPVLDTRFNTTDCQLSSVEQTFDERHYIIWNFVITGTISQTTDSDRITAQLDIFNYSDAQTTLWVLPARSAYGEGSFQVIRNILGNVQQMNQYIADISTALTNSNNYLSTIQSLVNQILTKMDNANVSGVITQQQATNQKLDSIKDSIDDQNDAENDAVSNIENQSVSDIPNSDSQQTQSLIATFSSFVSALGNVQAQGNCQITLPFAQQQGGSQNVDICTVKEDAGNDAITIINVIGSITMIVFYIPLVFIVLKMIYNEIRSFTNG